MLVEPDAIGVPNKPPLPVAAVEFVADDDENPPPKKLGVDAVFGSEELDAPNVGVEVPPRLNPLDDCFHCKRIQTKYNE